MIEGRFGVPEERLSGYEKFEGLDPADWVEHDYAIVNFDLRGCWNSEGNIPYVERLYSKIHTEMLIQHCEDG